jgi:ADP-ribose pyrophosphatase YjhB (NUDIX family)
MSEEQDVEKVRQAIMRYRELLDVLNARIQQAEKRYEALFVAVAAEKKTLPVKALQREAALLALDDMEPLRKATLAIYYDLHDMTKAFEEVYNNIAPTSDE